MAMLNYQQEAALFKLTHTLVKTSTEYDYFEMLDLYRQLEREGYVQMRSSATDGTSFQVRKTSKGQYYQFNWQYSEFR